MQLDKTVLDNKLNMSLVSELKTQFIFDIKVYSKELSMYENGKLLYSSQFRKTNGNIKVDKQTRFVTNKYIIAENGKTKDLAVASINTNLLSLYFNEPIGITTVFCDNHECFVNITKTTDGGYKVKFPGGDSNCYYYSAGVCNKIKINHTFYSAQIILTR
ncbi:MAG: DUF6134 family protein [Ferruginibacter sp.]